ncbi:MAG: exodeoxyribonuclease VII large subunit [Firmicutes bacterium]|nr:exodeoxyribonuclease VII large subunit [Bacillota bacterium]
MALKPVRVSQLNSYIKRILQSDPILGNISVIGEISNLKFHSSGHVYFSLKDEDSKVNCFLPAGNVGRIGFQLKEGIEVTAHGYIYLYERGGSYSINIRDMESAGQGDLAAAFEKLKLKLQQEGLFSQEKKKPLPVFPYKVAVVTSPTGAAVRDILKIIKQKNDVVDIMVYPVLVQGPAAPDEIAHAITDINENHTDVDVIITGRGGGSAEELWAFNDENVARSIYASKIPVISAVGHETDFTIADFVADLRAETPTAAAERAVPDTRELREYIDSIYSENRRNLKMLLEDRKKHLQLLDPKAFGRDLQSRVAMDHMRIENIMDDMTDNVRSMIRDKKYRLMLLKETLDGADPKAILKKGYSVITDENGVIVRDASVLEEDQLINIEAAVGHAKARVVSSGKDE